MNNKNNSNLDCSVSDLTLYFSASFLIPYFLMLAFNGIPLFYMELAVGQYLSLGTIGAWTALCPLARGKNMNLLLA